MQTRIFFSVVLVAAFLWSAEGEAADATGETVRIAVLVGNNRGAEDRELLEHAESDVDRFRGVLVSLGGFDKNNVFSLLGEEKSDLEQLMARVTSLVEEAVASKAKVLLLFYFSGHSGNWKMEMGTTRMPFKSVLDWLEACPATLKMAIVDSCDSAGFLTAKGGKLSPAKEVVPRDIILDIVASGVAIMVSSSPGEKSLEASRVAGAYFTYHVVSGLRGAADTDGDRKVTLEEVYNHARYWTFVDTHGRQTPWGSPELKGAKDQPLAYIGRDTPVVHFGPKLEGRLYLYCPKSGGLIAGLHKKRGRDSYLAAEEGVCRVFNQKGEILPNRPGLLEVSEFALKNGKQVSLRPKDFGRHKGPFDWELGKRNTIAAEVSFTHDIIPGLGMLFMGGLNYRREVGPMTLMFAAAYGQTDDGQDHDPVDVEDTWGGLDYQARVLNLEIAPLWRVDLAALDLLYGGMVGSKIMFQDAWSHGEYSAASVFVGVGGGVDVQVYKPLSLLFMCEYDFDFYKLDGELYVAPAIRGRLALGIEF